MGLLDFSLTDLLALGLALAAIYYGLKLARAEAERFREDLKERIYLEYTDRYREIVTNLPSNIFSERFDGDTLSDEQRRWLIAYFDICSEEIKLSHRGMIRKEVWTDWNQGVCRNLSSAVTRWAWVHLPLEGYSTLREFADACPPKEATSQGLDVASLIADVEQVVNRHLGGDKSDLAGAGAATEGLTLALADRVRQALAEFPGDPVYTEWEIEATARALLWTAWTAWMWTSKAEREVKPDARAKILRLKVDRLIFEATRAARVLGSGGGRPEGRSSLVDWGMDSG